MMQKHEYFLKTKSLMITSKTGYVKKIIQRAILSSIYFK